jgi:hypothetical protein
VHLKHGVTADLPATAAPGDELTRRRVITAVLDLQNRPEIAARIGQRQHLDDWLARSPLVGWIGAALDQARRFEVIEEVSHDRTVDSEMLGQSELATNRALVGDGKDLVAPRTAGNVSQSGARRPDVGPNEHAQAPSEVVCQRVLAAQSIANFVTVTRAVVHHPHPYGPSPISVAPNMFCRYDDLYRI